MLEVQRNRINSDEFTLAILEVVLGVDNLIFLAIVSSRLPKHQQKSARRIGLLLALVLRLLFLALMLWLTGLNKPWFSLFGRTFSMADMVLILGGVFLLYKGTQEIHSDISGREETARALKAASFFIVVTQIMILDLVFSIDSVVTAVGLVREYFIMAAAIFVAIMAMIFASEPLSNFVNRHPTVRMLALSFLILVGTALVADGFSFHIPRGYLYFAIAFSMAVETLNLMASKKRKKQKS